MSQPLTFTKQNFIFLQKERESLQNSLKKISEENEKLKTQVHDMKITVRENKKLLNDYIVNITNKDKLFEKLNLIIAELKEKIKRLEEKLKLNTSNNRINSSEIKETIDNKEINDKKDGNITIKYDEMKVNLTKINDNDVIKQEQKVINDEIINIKKQLDTFIEQNSFKKKINQSLKVNIKDNVTTNNNEKIKDSFDNSYISQEISSLSNSFDDEIKKGNNDKIFDIKKKYDNIENLTKFMEIDEKNDKLFLVDGNSNIWEILKRNDMNIEDIKKYEEK